MDSYNTCNTTKEINQMPRVEMTSSVLSTRLCKITIEIGGEFENIYFILDSTCTMALMKKDTVALKELMGNRVSEALEVAKPEQLYHVKSSENIADLGTCMDATPADIDLGSPCQCAPAWLKLDFCDWPVSQDCSKAEIPQEELNSRHFIAAVTAASAAPVLFDTERYKNRYRAYEFYVKLVGIIVKMLRLKSMKIDRHLSVDDQLQLN